MLGPVTEGELLLPLVDPGGFYNLVEGRFEDIAGHGGAVAVVVKVEGLVKALVDQPPGVVGCVVVQLGGVVGSVEAFGEALGADFELVGGVGELSLDARAFYTDGVAAFLNLGSAELAIGGEVDEAFFADLQLGQLLAEGRMEFVGQLLLLAHSFAESGFQFVSEVVGEVDAVTVVASDFVLHLGDRQVWQVAEAFLAGAAEVVAIAFMVAAGGFGVDEAAAAALFVAALAEQQPFQVVGEDAVALAAG